MHLTRGQTAIKVRSRTDMLFLRVCRIIIVLLLSASTILVAVHNLKGSADNTYEVLGNTVCSSFSDKQVVVLKFPMIPNVRPC